MKTKAKADGLTPASMPPDPVREMTRHERTAAQRLLYHRDRHAPAPKYKVTVADGRTTIDPDHPDKAAAYALMTNAFATGDGQFAEGLLTQLANVARSGTDLTAAELNTIVATVHAIGPRDPTEALLAAQMAAIHQATMVAARRLNHVETVDQQNSSSGMLNKLARTFAAQVETLKRYRSTGEQNVHVTHQHVSVTARQAVVGINPGGGGTHERASQSHALGTSAAPSSNDARGTALLGHEQTVPAAMQGTSGEGAECMSDARGTRGRSERPG